MSSASIVKLPRRPVVMAEGDAGEVATGTNAVMLGRRLAQQVKDLILSGELAPGERIRQEELAARFSTSRIPVREALHFLEREGLVTVRPNSGCWVTKLDLAECVEIYRIRERLEPMAFAESIARLDERVLDELEAMVAAMEQCDDMGEFLRIDRLFHLGSYAAAGMPELLELITRYWNRTQQYRRVFTDLVGPAGKVLMDYEHRLLIDSMRRRDGEGGAVLLHGHIRRTRMALESNPNLFPKG